MKTKTLFLIIYAISFNITAQECDCLKNIGLLQQKIELNQASYQHQVIEQKRFGDYILFKTEINNKAKKIESKKDCIALVSLYLSFFRDEHSFVSYIKDYTPKSNVVIKSNRQKIIESVPFEGIWHFQDGSFSINIFPAKTTFGEYIAVIDQEKSKSWKKGQLKIEFYKTSNGTFNCIYWRQNIIPRSFSVTYTDSTLQIGRNLIFHRKKQHQYKHSNTSNNLHFESLSDETNYIRIPSFDLSFKSRIDSLIAMNKIKITSKTNLIMDVRDNGGGGFDAFKSILPFILDSNVTETPYYGSVWLSKDNFEYYNQTKYEFAETQQDSTNELKYVEFLRGHINHFSPIERSIDTIVLEKNAPLNIAIIYNKNTASSAEGFILQARNSNKVKTYGENSAGAVSYGDWLPFNLPELNIWVAITTKKMIFKNNEDFESLGIAPEVDLTKVNENEWLNIVLEKIRK